MCETRVRDNQLRKKNYCTQYRTVFKKNHKEAWVRFIILTWDDDKQDRGLPSQGWENLSSDKTYRRNYYVKKSVL
jgi:hypothetical protein